MPREAYARAAARSSALTAGLPATLPLALTLTCQRRLGLLTRTCQVPLGLEGLLAGAAQDRRLLQGRAGDAELAAARARAGQQAARAGLAVARGFGVAPQPQRVLQVAELCGVAVGGLVGQVGLRQAGLGVGRNVQVDLAGQGGVALVVPAALPAGVLDASGVGQAVGGLVQQGGEHLPRAALEALTGDQDLGAVGVGYLPAGSGEVPPLEQAPPGFAAG